MRRIAAVTTVLLVVSIAQVGHTTDPGPYRVCMHVPITGAMPIPRHPDRFGGFYFSMVNTELGGVDGHPIEFRVYNDGHNPAGARRAAEECRRDGVDLLVGPYGAQQISSVSGWAEINQVPYLHGSVPQGMLDPSITWSAGIGATDEAQMRMLGDALATSDHDSIALIRIDAPRFDHGRAALIDALAAHGVTLAVDHAVSPVERFFVETYQQLRAEEVTAVVLYVTPQVATRLLEQRPPDVSPVWLAPSLSLGTLGFARAARGQTVALVSDLSPVYDPDDETLPWHDEFEEFHRIFDTYAVEADPPRDELDWTAYLRAKQIHRFLDALDGDVSADAIRSSFSTYAESPAESFPTCALNFAAHPRFGSNAWHVETLIGEEWEPLTGCTGSLAIDLSPPTIACNGPLLATKPLRCTLSHPVSGIASYALGVDGIPFDRDTAYGHGACADEVIVEEQLPPGLAQVEVRAISCDGLVASHATVAISA